jgi:cell division protein FtsB
MGMFGEPRRQVFKPSIYQPGRRNRRLPRWLVLLGIGIAVGAGGVVFLQTNYGPPHLSTEQSEQVRSELNAATLERQRLQAQIDDLQRQLETSRAAQAQAQNQSAPIASQPVIAPAEPAVPVTTPAAPQSMPAMPRMPSMPAAPTMPAVPAMPAAPTMPASPVMPAATMPAMPSADSADASATPVPAKPVARRPAQRYEEPHSELRMTVIPASPK